MRGARGEIKDEVETARQQVTSIETVKEHVSELRELLGEGTAEERRQFVKSFVNEIVVDGRMAMLRYTVPVLPKDNQTVRNEEVLPVVPLGGAGGTRTPGPLRAKEVLSQLSYSPTLPTL